MSDIYFIGCDMGGWHTKETDAIAIMKWDGTNLSHSNVDNGQLFYPFNKVNDISSNNAIDIKNHIIISIDAALGWPIQFTIHVNSIKEADYKPTFNVDDGQFQNPYLFRKTGRFVKSVIKTEPLSAVKDNLCSNFTEAQALVEWFKKHYNDLYRPPFDEYKKSEAVNKKHTLIEVYPAASKKSTKYQKLDDPDTNYPMSRLGNTDIADAKRCAMTAVCYAKTIGLIDNTNYPEVYTPDDASAMGYDMCAIRKEGWIFAPK
ncbi:MAG: hypothetical protein GF399_06690 [Candidatus Coatesbacteria bacterium]|nr:hypothetical protein [Candidatus Coatesbacteria bacterium]